MTAQTATFTREGALAGARRVIPIALGGILYDLIVGMLAREAGMTQMEAILLHALVFAGTAQLAALGMWVLPLPMLAILASTAIINSRYLLLGASLHPYMSRLPLHKAYSTLFFLTDETWALAQGEFETGRTDVGYLAGSGMLLWLLGFPGIIIGYSVGTLISDPAALGLDFLFPAVLIALLVSMWKGTGTAFPWLVAGTASLVCVAVLPGNWYIVVGALAGSLAGAWRDAR